MILRLSFILIFLFSLSLSAQEYIDTASRSRIREIFFNTGLVMERNHIGTLSEFKTLAPGSIILNDSLPEFFTEDAFNVSGNLHVSGSLGLYLGKKGSLRPGKILRLGFSYLSGNTITGWYGYQTRFTFDTLTSSQSGQNIYLDSVTTQYYNMNYQYEQLRLEASLIFSTRTTSRWSAYAGLGLSAGISLRVETAIARSIDRRVESWSYSTNTYTISGAESEMMWEVARNDLNLGFSFFAPLGLDFRVGKKSSFWKMVHFFYEIRPGISATSVPELRTFLHASLQQCIGIRVIWD